MTLEKEKYSNLSYDELSLIVNKSFSTTQNILKTVKETEVSFTEVYEILGFKDEDDFEDDV